jgi:hypothetical protein
MRWGFYLFGVNLKGRGIWKVLDRKWRVHRPVKKRQPPHPPRLEKKIITKRTAMYWMYSTYWRCIKRSGFCAVSAYLLHAEKHMQFCEVQRSVDWNGFLNDPRGKTRLAIRFRIPGDSVPYSTWWATLHVHQTNHFQDFFTLTNNWMLELEFFMHCIRYIQRSTTIHPLKS